MVNWVIEVSNFGTKIFRDFYMQTFFEMQRFYTLDIHFFLPTSRTISKKILVVCSREFLESLELMTKK